MIVPDGVGLVDGPGDVDASADVVGSDDGSADGAGGAAGAPCATDGSGELVAAGTLPSGPLLLPHAPTSAVTASTTARRRVGRWAIMSVPRGSGFIDGQPRRAASRPHRRPVTVGSRAGRARSR